MSLIWSKLCYLRVLAWVEFLNLEVEEENNFYFLKENNLFLLVSDSVMFFWCLLSLKGFLLIFNSYYWEGVNINTIKKIWI